MRTKILYLLLFLTNYQFAFSDDTFILFGAGGVTLPDENIIKINNVELVNEKIGIELQNNQYKVNVLFDFYNPGPNVLYNIGFPLKSEHNGILNLEKKIPIDGFITTVNGKISHFHYTTKTREKNIEGWFLKTVEFNSNAHTLITISYNSDYGSISNSLYATYYFGTGKNWKGTIQDLEITIRNNSNLVAWNCTINPINENTQETISLLSANETKLVYRNIKPTIDDEFRIKASKFPDLDLWQGEFGSIAYNIRDLILLTQSQLRTYRNAIYAEHGYIFKSKDLRELFSDPKMKWLDNWYQPKLHDVEDLLTNTEKSNIKIIKQLEVLRKERIANFTQK